MTTTTRQYQPIANDPLNTRIYTLDNGLKIYLTVNKNEPRIQTHIAVKAGFKDDPDDTTGLAHYLEHMMFKGSDRIGTNNWEQEGPLINEITELFEKHRQTSDPEEKKKLYTRIDELSYEAASYAIPNEYDKLISMIGAKNTNAYTAFDQTVFMNDIPANELSRWLKIESERFRKLVLRLFHTELETVYEEYNMRNQDSDKIKVFDALFDGLFLEHKYGRQPSIGKPEHLKNPSMQAVYDFFSTYYVPNNMAICLSGDLDPDQTVDLIDQYFGDYKPGKLPDRQKPKEPHLTKSVQTAVWGNEAANFTMAYKADGFGSYESRVLRVIGSLLYNQRAGLIDLNVNQNQQVMEAIGDYLGLEDHSLLLFNGVPHQDQSLEQVKQHILKQVENIRQGNFDDWLIEAVINDLKLKQIQQYESNLGRSEAFVDAFTNGVDWEDYVNEINKLETITKEDVIAFANENLKDNYVAVFKHQGEDPDTFRIEKPPITPLKLNRKDQSSFFKEVEAMEVGALEPKFLNFEQDLYQDQFNDQIPFYYVQNNLNETFKFYYIFDMGRIHDPVLPVAIRYLPFLGTHDMSPQEVHKEFFRLGLSFDVSVTKDQVKVHLEGLEENLEAGIKLFEYLLANARPNDQTFKSLIANILKKREDTKSDKNVILKEALLNYAKYGPTNPFSYRLSNEQLYKLDPQDLVDYIKSLNQYPHRIFYYGQMPPSQVKSITQQYHPQFDHLKPIPQKQQFEESTFDQNDVYLVDYNMVQSEMVLLSRDETFNKANVPYIMLLNEYFGGGLSSIVFQEIRESKALAYAAFSFLTTPHEKQDSHYVIGYVGTQSDKLKEASGALENLMGDLPYAKEQFDGAKGAVLKRLESERVNGPDIFWTYEEARKRGLDYDLRQEIYETVQSLDFKAIKMFFDHHIKGKYFNYLILGSKEHLDLNELNALGKLQELDLETVFNY